MIYEGKERVMLSLFIMSLIITILSWAYWMYWAILPISIFFLYLCVSMFETRNMFMFEPNLHYWKEANEEDY